jgi:hypothetical protein
MTPRNRAFLFRDSETSAEMIMSRYIRKSYDTLLIAEDIDIVHRRINWENPLGLLISILQ